jgi:hypothetical protein
MKTALILFLSVIATQITFSQSVEGHVKDSSTGLGISSSLSWQRSFDGKWSVFKGLGGIDWNLSILAICKVFKKIAGK